MGCQMEEGGGQTADDGRSPRERTAHQEYAKVAEAGVVRLPAMVWSGRCLPALPDGGTQSALSAGPNSWSSGSSNGAIAAFGVQRIRSETTASSRPDDQTGTWRWSISTTQYSGIPRRR